MQKDGEIAVVIVNNPPVNAPVSYTHLDVYKRQGPAAYSASKAGVINLSLIHI